MAERVGFEPTVGCPTTVFKTVAIDHSATSPGDRPIEPDPAARSPDRVQRAVFRKRTPPTLPPEWLIVGLGNPGPQYAGTRHNVGFDLVERLANDHRIQVRTAKHRALMGVGMVAGVPVALAKPLTFMNLSGQSVAPLARSFGIPPERILVVADDMDLALGRLRLRGSGGSGGHNGHKSLIASLGTQDYPRLRIGIGKDEVAIDHVLSKFLPDERPVVDEVLKKAAGVVERLLTDGLERATEQAALA